jgi:acyl phosphate:glycerol-3-phosphate acyltransferase
MAVLLWALLGYAVGSIQWAYVLAVAGGRRSDLDRVERGAGEVDAHLVLKESGAGRLAAGAATLDVLKAFGVVLLAVLLGGPYEASAAAVGAVAGHCWPPVAARFAGRGLAAAAGAFLALLPVEFVIGGAITGIGHLLNAGGISSSIGFGSVFVLAVLRGQPASHLVAAATILAMIVARRLEGVGDDVEAGVPLRQAVVRRALFDVSARASK